MSSTPSRAPFWVTRRSSVELLGVGLLTAAMGVVNYRYDLGTAIGLLYSIPIFVASLLANRKVIWLSLVGCTFLVVVGSNLSLAVASDWRAIASRGLALVAIYSMAIVGLLRCNESEEAERKDSSSLAQAERRLVRTFLMYTAVPPALIIPFFVGLNAVTFDKLRKTEVVATDAGVVAEQKVRILDLSRTLTVNASLAAATGDLAWEQRYQQDDLELDETLEVLLQAGPAEYRAQLSAVVAERGRLTEVETQVFERLRDGRQEDAVALLSSPAYVAASEALGDRLKNLGSSRSTGQSVGGSEAEGSTAGASWQVLQKRLGVLGMIILSFWISSAMMATRSQRQAMRYNKQLAERAEQLERSNADLEQFAYVASHDLQEPLRMVAEFTKRLQGEMGDRLVEPSKSYLGFVLDGATRMQALVEGLLSYARIDSRESAVGRVELDQLLKEVVDDHLELIAESEAEISHEGLPAVIGDESQLRQLFGNLISNAMKFRGSRSPRISVFAEARGEKVRLSVQDNGIGIESRYQERIFKMFNRVHSREEFDGTGIGLSICKRIAERHGSTMDVVSEVGEGATFSFELTAAGVRSPFGAAGMQGRRQV